MPDIYYAISSKTDVNGEKIELTSKQKFDKNSLEKAKALCDEYNKFPAVVTGKKVKKDTLSPPETFFAYKTSKRSGQKV